MFSQYFGHYLLNKGLITNDQLKDALNLQQSTHVKLGVLSVNEGFMSGIQVEEVHQKQTQVDKRFGEIAIEMGYLTEEQLEHLLSCQKQNHLLLGQALVDQNYLSIDKFSSALNEYKKEHSLSDDQFEAMKNGDIDVIVNSLIDLNDKNRSFYTDYLSLFAKNLIRFIDDQIYIETKPIDSEIQSDWFVSQVINGEASLFTGLLLEESVFLKFAEIYAEEELEEVDELAQASVSEFLNLHNGIFTVNMSNKGIELNMTPQQVSYNPRMTDSSYGYIISINSSFGHFSLVLSDQPDKVKIEAGEKTTVS